eukprot:Hpha_TRINITY_DN9463_c0_g2::TRINITY_DN9463_c0_g2_i1::g.139051::m.139051
MSLSVRGCLPAGRRAAWGSVASCDGGVVVVVDAAARYCGGGLVECETDTDWEDVACVLATHPCGLCAVPFVTERMGWRGSVFATHPIIVAARHQTVSWAAAARGARRRKEAGSTHRRCFTESEAVEGLARACAVTYGECVEVAAGLRATALPASGCIGASCWLLESRHGTVLHVGIG